ncbi:hypothetical protein DFH09DRAFT_393917 [Mycena vulgaris]|nr:hypothetical protein DFH09DRAFT_393917 [Mycena vulgaris]
MATQSCSCSRRNWSDADLTLFGYHSSHSVPSFALDPYPAPCLYLRMPTDTNIPGLGPPPLRHRSPRRQPLHHRQRPRSSTDQCESLAPKQIPHPYRTLPPKRPHFPPHAALSSNLTLSHTPSPHALLTLPQFLQTSHSSPSPTIASVHQGIEHLAPHLALPSARWLPSSPPLSRLPSLRLSSSSPPSCLLSSRRAL